jgi:hypothetical protein
MLQIKNDFCKKSGARLVQIVFQLQHMSSSYSCITLLVLLKQASWQTIKYGNYLIIQRLSHQTEIYKGLI